MKMTRMIKNLDGGGFFLLLMVLLISTDIAILLDIPFLRQILGFLFLTILPGLLILQILKLNELGSSEKFILTWGLSISFVLLFGLLINNSSLSLGYETPLAAIFLLILFNLVFVVLAIIGYKTNKDLLLSPPNLNLSTTEKAFLIVPILFPALSIFGMHVMNITDNNIILMFLLFLIPAYVAFVCLFNQRFPKRLYPVVIFSISISLLLLMALRSNHIIGSDIHLEYYFFQTTTDNLHWSVFGHGTLDACLAISLLPTIYHSILNIPSEFLYKIIYSLLYSISPVVIYILSKKYVEERYAFLASCFFMFQSYFLITAWNPRTSIAILFFALAMMTLFSDKIDPLKKRILFIVFMASCMVSHYSTTYIFFFIMIGTFIGIEVLSKKYRFKKIVSLTIVILFFSMIFFWYSQVTETAFNSGVSFVEDTLSNLNRFFIEESRTKAIKPLLGQEFEYPILSRINFVLTWSTFILIGIGVLTMIKRYKEMIAISNVKVKKPNFLKTKFEMEYLAIVLMCAGLLVIMIALPYISVGYDLWRVYSLAIVILSVCFIVGAMTLSKHFFFFYKKRKPVLKEKNNGSQVRAYLLILLILVPYFLFYSGAIHQLFVIHNSIIFNSEGEMYDYLYVHDQDSYGAKWLSKFSEKKSIIQTDHQGMYRLISQGGININSIDERSLSKNKELPKGLIYLRYTNTIQGKLMWSNRSYNTSEISNALYKTNKIYDNDVVIYKNN